jgi:hypothetical protein
MASLPRGPASPASGGKSDSRKIALYEPSQECLDKATLGRDVSAGLTEFLKNLLRRRKWVRKINIPSGRDDVAAVLVWTTTLKPAGFEMLSELHVYFAGRTLIEKWEVAGESERIRSLPKEAFQAIDITKVRVEGKVVALEFTVPRPGGKSSAYITAFDFTGEGPDVRTVVHPLLRMED